MKESLAKTAYSSFFMEWEEFLGSIEVKTLG